RRCIFALFSRWRERKSGSQQPGSFFYLRSHRAQSSCDTLGFTIRVVPLLRFRSFPDSRKRLRKVASVDSRRIEAVAIPVTAREPFGQKERLLGVCQEVVELDDLVGG